MVAGDANQFPRWQHLSSEVAATVHGRYVEDDPGAGADGTAASGWSVLEHRQAVEHWARRPRAPQPTVLQRTNTPSSAIAEGPRDASCQLKSCQYDHLQQPAVGLR